MYKYTDFEIYKVSPNRYKKMKEQIDTNSMPQMRTLSLKTQSRSLK